MSDLLTIGPGIVLDQIGSGPAAATYLVRIPETQLPAVIKRIPVATELKPGTLSRFRELAERARSVGHSMVVVPHACHEILRTSESPRTLARSDKGVSPSRRRRRVSTTNELVCELAVASRLVEGLSLSQMLLRRGRFPAAVVQEIARQLLESLAALDAAGIVHGEILSENVLIDGKGKAILVDAGVRPCVQPEFSFSATIDPRRYSGIAPELIGTSQPYSHRSDLYALGCLLWELLTARPVFVGGDPLARLAEHQTTRIPDVREIAPDTPSSLAEVILWLTDPDAERRPRSAAEVLGRGASGSSKRNGNQESLRPSANLTASSTPQPNARSTSNAGTSGQATSGQLAGREHGSAPRTLPARSGRRSLSKFSAAFSSRPIGRTKPSRANARFAGHIAVASLVVLLACAALLTLHGQSREWVTAAIAASTSGDGRPPSAAAEIDGAGSEPRLQRASEVRAAKSAKQLPRPDADGLVALTDAGPWRAESLLWSGQRLTVRGPVSGSALLVVDRAIRFRASDVVIENVEIRFEEPEIATLPVAAVSAVDSPNEDAAPERPVVPSLQIESQLLSVSDCAFETGRPPANRASEKRDAPAGADGERADSQPQADLSPFAFIWTPLNPRDSLPGQISLTNCRLIGDRSSIGLAGLRHRVRCENVLQSGAGSLFVIAQSRQPGRHDFRLQHCTLRNSGGLLEARLNDGNAWRSQVRLQPVACVFDLSGRGSLAAGTLVRFRADMLTPKWAETLVIDGSDSIARPDLRLVEGMSRDGRNRQELDASSVMLNGLVGAAFEFQASAMDGDLAGSILKSHDASLASTERPGVGVSRTAANGQARSVSTGLELQTEPKLQTEPELQSRRPAEKLKQLPTVESEATR